MATTVKSPSKLPGRNSKEWSTVSIKGYVLIMMQYLRVSPSYTYAGKVIAENIPPERQRVHLAELYEGKRPLNDVEIDSLVNNFQDVLKTYREFGDVCSISFDEWWEQRGLAIFGYDHYRPSVRQLSQLAKEQSEDEQLLPMLDRYFQVVRPKEGLPPALILSLPLGINKKVLLAQVGKLIDKSNVLPQARAQKAKRPLAAKRLRSAPLFTGLKLMWAHARLPSMQLWKLGSHFNVSPANQMGELPSNIKLSQKNVVERQRMAALTHRMLKKAQLIAENAARGEFPSSAKRVLPRFDCQEIDKRIRAATPATKARKA